MNRTTPLLIVAAMGLTSAATYYFATAHRVLPSASASESGKEGAATAEKPFRIEGLVVRRAEAGPGWETLALTGRVTIPPERLVKVSPRIEGKVVAAYGTIGTPVQRGQLMAVVSSVALAEARAQLRQAQGRADAAVRSLEQEARMVGLGGVGDRQLEEARTADIAAQSGLAEAKSEVAQAKSEVARADTELSQCRSRLNRAKELFTDMIMSRQDLESAEAEFRRDSATVDAAQSRLAGAEAAVERARSHAEIAAGYVAREEKLHRGKLLDTRAMMTARSAVDTARLEANAAEDRIRAMGADPRATGDTIAVTAPISGRIVSRQTNVGQMATPADEMFAIADTTVVWVEADLFERDMGRVRTGQRAEVRFDSEPDRAWMAVVQSVGDVLNPESRTAKVRLALANGAGGLRSGMFANVSLQTARQGSTVLIPRQAVLDDAGKKIVYTPCMECPEDQKAGTNACGAYDRLEVTTGALRDSRIEIRKGVEPGTKVVVEGQFQIKSALGSGQLKAGCTDH
ncbi:MAG: efflux RND transporter periplasmic adaptor subunit [Armatimonadetes bacterium]|nr:efflux RND transporter periplasmic adaptor subunit [Armatimonadota bacterium]